MIEISTEQVRQWENIEHPEAGADRCFARACRVPREADPGSKIVQRRILVHGLAGGDLRIRQVTEICC